jgi:hypothetical protein
VFARKSLINVKKLTSKRKIVVSAFVSVKAYIEKT